MKKMHIPKILAATAIAGMMACAADGQPTIYSQNLVGYVNLSIYTGTNFIANQFDNGQGNTLDTLIPPSGTLMVVPEGAEFTEWNPTAGQFLPFSTYDTVNGWSINYALTYGEGAMLITPTLFTNTFLGTVSSAVSGNGGELTFTPPLVTSTGLMLLSCVAPLNDATFYDVAGRNPQNGEWVTMLDPETQVYTTTTFDDGSWNNGAPDLNVGESAFFYLESVPEPSVVCLGVTGLLAIGWRWRRLRK
jgi:hypothetical protein